MGLPPLLKLPGEVQYREHFRQHYVGGRNVVTTADGMDVHFHESSFDHAFYTTFQRGSGLKDLFAIERAERMDWLRAVLQAPSVPSHRDTRTKGKLRRVFLEASVSYVVVVQADRKRPSRAYFVTAYVADRPGTVPKIQQMPRW